MVASGEQFTIAHGSKSAVITETGATLRRFVDGDTPILWEFPAEEFSTGGRGQVLCPWPNRLDNGQFSFEGVCGTAALDEPAAHNAIHGLVRWLRFDLVAHESDAVSLSCVVVRQPAYPFRLRVELTYRLDNDGLVVETTLSSEDESPVPVGLGFHPYLVAPGGVDASCLGLPALTHLVMDSRGLPVRTESIASFVSKHSLVAARYPGALALSEAVLDDCFGELQRTDTHWRVQFWPDDTHRVELWADEAFKYVMVYTGDTLGEGLARRGVAIEAMTCPPNALAAGADLIVLAPNESVTCRWGLSGLLDA